MSSFYERINILGAPDTACTTDNERGYCEAIRECLPIAEQADAEIERLREALAEAASHLEPAAAVEAYAALMEGEA